MRRQSMQHELDRFDADLPIARAWTPPSTWYVSPAFAELEREHVFKHTWQPVARLEQLRGPGDYVSGRLVGEPWVIVRTEQGSLKAFHNSCRHKGREVVQGCGTAPQLVCGYHAWSYDLEGKLRSCPRMAGIEDFDRAGMSLEEVALETWGPWVFLNFDPDSRPLAESLGPLADRLDRSRWADLRFVAERTWDIECNWKVYIDNYLDGGYHIPHMHPSLDAQLDMSTYRTELFETYSIQSSGAAQESDGRIAFDAGDRIGGEALYIWLYPNFMLNRYGPCLDTNYVIPLAEDRCRVYYEFYFRETEGTDAEAFVAGSIEQSAVTQREDIAICESVQCGLASTGYDRGRYAPQVEMGEYHFHGLLARHLRDALRQAENA